MSRTIDYEGDSGWQLVWNYPFATPSNMHKIFTELGIGEYEKLGGIEDQLTLTRKDLQKLEAEIQRLQHIEVSNDDQWLAPMLEAVCYCIRTNPNEEQFIFEGDL